MTTGFAAVIIGVAVYATDWCVLRGANTIITATTPVISSIMGAAIVHLALRFCAINEKWILLFPDFAFRGLFGNVEDHETRRIVSYLIEAAPCVVVIETVLKL